MICSEQTPE